MNEKMSQEDIDRLLSGNASLEEPEQNILNPIETDTLGEIGNISMGSAATTLSMLLGNKVDITTPTVTEHKTIEEILAITDNYVTVEITYTQGLNGTTVFVLNHQDTAIIADLMMGGDGKVVDPEVGELQLSAVGEAMNQMMGTVATTLSSMLNIGIDITPPTVKSHQQDVPLDISKEITQVPVVSVRFQLKVGDLIDSEFVQILDISSAKNQIDMLMKAMGSYETPEPEPIPVSAPAPVVPPPVQPYQSIPAPSSQSYATPTPAMQYNTPPVQPAMQTPVTVQPVQFTSFDAHPATHGESGRNLDLLMDVRLKLTVELGRTELSIKKVLELARGSVIELDKVAGEPVELFANGKLIAKGEVVVIEDNFGLRITNIVSPDNRIKSI